MKVAGRRRPMLPARQRFRARGLRITRPLEQLQADERRDGTGEQRGVDLWKQSGEDRRPPPAIEAMKNRDRERRRRDPGVGLVVLENELPALPVTDEISRAPVSFWHDHVTRLFFPAGFPRQLRRWTLEVDERAESELGVRRHECLEVFLEFSRDALAPRRAVPRPQFVSCRGKLLLERLEHST